MGLTSMEGPLMALLLKMLENCLAWTLIEAPLLGLDELGLDKLGLELLHAFTIKFSLEKNLGLKIIRRLFYFLHFYFCFLF